ncbi:ABC transporter permease [Mycolicibacterium sp. YH-1]|uniref:ABC transporter permease n=1 Tax=Mycolicibacterium sp. YH-1 TaxID=2908837 RepID=UPI001F4BE911|nr:ABC transporter permease [Mycolicibacterium sp. YH-1]UNB52928.1 ABC transporter permease [Mycolicibacterium sp. YH-1]
MNTLIRFWSLSVSARLGIVVAVGLVLLALLGPVFAPGDPDVLVGPPFGAPEPGHPLGYDQLGRDILSRLLAGGRVTVLLALVGVAGTYAIGLPLGVIAGLKGGRIDASIMRVLDVILAFPPLLFLLVLAAASGVGPSVVFVAIVFGNVAWLARIARAATSEVRTRGYVDAARLRGETLPSIVMREVVPNIAHTLYADVGMRFTTVILFVAGACYLGVGVQPPHADWARMVSENMSGLTVAPVAVLAPVALITLLTVAINVAADGLQSGPAKPRQATQTKDAQHGTGLVPSHLEVGRD